MTNGRWMGWLAILALAIAVLPFARAIPTGASLVSNTTEFGPTRSPVALSHNQSTITTVVLSALQQDTYWKAYVGNVSGSLTLDDASNFTIYDWPSTGAVAGEVYASRANALTFISPACADTATVDTEHSFLGMSASSRDSIRRTFNSTDHTATDVAGTLLSSCNMTATYISDTAVGQNNTATFQEFLMEDATNNLAYVAIINNNQVGYDGSVYDFQMLVGENNNATSHVTYYFYVELDAT